MANQKYDASSISILEGLEAIRSRSDPDPGRT